MSASIFGNRRTWHSPRRWAWIGLAWLTLGPGPEADAGPIRRADQARLAARVNVRGSYWDRYFTRALQTRQLRVRQPHALRYLSADANGRLPDSAFVEYLHWRRSLNPLRFDHFHPWLGPILRHDEDSHQIVPPPPITPGIVTPPPDVPPPPDNPPPDNPPPDVPPPQVPEPSSFLIALGLLGSGIAARRWARIRA